MKAVVSRLPIIGRGGRRSKQGRSECCGDQRNEGDSTGHRFLLLMSISCDGFTPVTNCTRSRDFLADPVLQLIQRLLLRSRDVALVKLGV